MAILIPEGYRHYFLLAAILAVGFTLRLPMHHNLLIGDEGEIALIAQRIVLGEIPYRDIYYQKGPVLPYLLAGMFTICGDDISTIRLFTTLWMMGTAVFVYLVAKDLAGISAGLIGASAYMTLSLVQCSYTHSLSNENHMNLWFMCGTWLLWRGTTPSHFLAGCAAGMATASKASGMMLAVYLLTHNILIYTRYSSLDHGLKRAGELVKSTTLQATGFLVITGGWLLLFVCFGGFEALMECVIYNLGEDLSYRDSSLQRFLTNSTEVFQSEIRWASFLWITGVIGIIYQAFTKSHTANKHLYILLFLCTLAAIRAGFPYRHYYDLFISVLAVGTGCLFYLGVSLLHLKNSRSITGWILVTSIALSLLIPQASLCHTLLTGSPQRDDLLPFPANISDRVSQYLTKSSKKYDSLIVIGSEPQIYYYAHLPNATRHVITYMLTAPFSFAERYQDELIQDIQGRPDWIILVNHRSSVSIDWSSSGVKRQHRLISHVHSAMGRDYELAKYFSEKVYQGDTEVGITGELFVYRRND